MIVLSFDTSFCDFKEDTAIIDVLSWLKSLNKLIGSGLASCDVLLLDLIVLYDVAHEVLNNVPLTLLQDCLLHKFLDTRVVYHVLDVLLTPKAFSSNLVLLEAEPMFSVERPAEHGFLTTAEELGSEGHGAVAWIAKCEDSPIVDTIDHLIIIVFRIFLFMIIISRIFLTMVALPITLLEIEFLEHTFVVDKGLVIAYEQGSEACKDRRVTTKVRE